MMIYDLCPNLRKITTWKVRFSLPDQRGFCLRCELWVTENGDALSRGAIFEAPINYMSEAPEVHAYIYRRQKLLSIPNISRVIIQPDIMSKLSNFSFRIIG